MVIELLDRPYYVGQEYDLILDLKPEDGLRLTESVQSMAGGNLNISYSLPFSIKNTPKNSILLKDSQETYLRCRVRAEGQELPFTGLTWYQHDETEISIELIHAQKDWASQLLNKKLNQIEYRANGSISMIESEVYNNWSTQNIWQDGEIPFYLPLIRYNGLLPQIYTDVEQGIDFSKDTSGYANVAYNDLRPLISVLFVLQEMFKLIGWKFKSPFLESGLGRRLFCYILQEKFAVDNGLRVNYHVSLDTGGTPNANTVINFNTDTGTGDYNGGSYVFNPSFPESHFISPFLHPIKLNLKTSLKLAHGSGTKKIIEVTIRVMYDTPSSVNNVFDYKKEDFVIEVGQTLECFVEWDNAIVLPLYRVEVSAKIVGGGTLSVYEGSWFEGKGADNSYYYGDLLNPKIKEDSCLDFLKGVAHTINGHFLTDPFTKEVTLFPPIRATIQGETFEGFYTLYTRDIEGSGFKISRDRSTNKNYKIGWKSPQDSAAEKFPEYGKKIILLDSTKTEDNENLNPYFQSVFEGFVLKDKSYEYTPIVVAINTSEDSIPNDLIDPFIVEVIGLQAQSSRNATAYEVSAASVDRHFTLISIQSEAPVTYDLIPYVTQIPTAYGHTGLPLINTYGYSYGDFYTDLGQSFYHPLVKTKTIEFISPEIYLHEVVSQQICRDKISVLIEGQPHIVYPTAINDFQEGLPSIMTGVIGIINNPPPCDGWVTKADYKAFLTVNTGGFSFNAYLSSFFLNGVQLIDSPILIGNPNGMGAVAFYDYLVSVINVFIPSTFINPNVSLEVNKCGWFQITLRKEIGATLIDEWLRFDETGSWQNILLNSGAAPDAASWRLIDEPKNKVNRKIA